ncbi:hypothetical protein OZ411_06650 [Bradyrhizobium sp. Arg237L]|uniref:hypothetical protein n=1 Tax=Bradyrhizobium sp. Arg237L TaxID=3003352 RepID=UPI00249EC946|nr:hypothetical protein [Bradyrhizobium sp. Arg237L]MDI4232492.1 hypothetical protein [Bradyrhizobium sp. Arg237L]
MRWPIPLSTKWRRRSWTPSRAGLQDDDSHDIIIHRTRYVVRRLTTGAVKTYGWMAEFDGEAIEVNDALETLAYLDRELNQRLRGNAG